MLNSDTLHFKAKHVTNYTYCVNLVITYCITIVWCAEECTGQCDLSWHEMQWVYLYFTSIKGKSLSWISNIFLKSSCSVSVCWHVFTSLLRLGTFFLSSFYFNYSFVDSILSSYSFITAFSFWSSTRMKWNTVSKSQSKLQLTLNKHRPEKSMFWSQISCVQYGKD